MNPDGSRSESTPDVGEVIRMILQNPELVDQLRKIGKAEAEDEAIETGSFGQSADDADAPGGDAPKTADAPADRESTAASAEAKSGGEQKWMTKRREHLLCALKPYLSKERAGAIDAAITVARILDTVRVK